MPETQLEQRLHKCPFSLFVQTFFGINPNEDTTSSVFEAAFMMCMMKPVFEKLRDLRKAMEAGDQGDTVAEHNKLMTDTVCISHTW
jgi:hypothetical protein